MSTFALRQKHIAVARRDSGLVEVTRNQAPWIAKLWTATDYPDGMENREPYCAAGQAYCLQQWLQNDDVLKALKMSKIQAEKWRCKSAVAFRWLDWAKSKNLTVLPKSCILHAADIVVYTYSHIELVTDDDGTKDGPFTAIGYNTNAAGAADGEGCFEKPRTRSKVKAFIRILP